MPGPAVDPHWVSENVFTAADIGTSDAWFAEIDASSQSVVDHMRSQGFDVAPIRQDPVWQFVERHTLESERPASILDVARPITTEVLIPAATGLHSTIGNLRRTPFVFLMDRSGVNAIVTRADLQRPSVAIVALALILLTERELMGMVDRHYGDAWTASIPPARLEKVGEILQARQRQNVEIGLLECLPFDDLLTLVGKSAELRSAVGYPARTRFDAWKERLGRTRNALAHAGDLFDAEPDPQAAIELFLAIVDFSVAAWQANRDRSS